MTAPVLDIRARVLCCTAVPHPDAVKALSAYAPHADVVDVTGDNYAYWREIRERWAGERDLIIIEQDIEIGPDTIATLENCSQDWCCYAYPIFRTRVRLRVGLGCIKISAAAQRKVTAALVEQGFTSCAACRGKGCWWHLDGRVAAMLKKGGFFPHVHGDVTHHHDYETGRAGDEDGMPVEWYFEEDADTSAALVLDPDLVPPFAFSQSGRAAAAAADELARVAGMLSAEPSLAAPLGEMAPFPLGVITAAPAYATDKVEQGYLPAYNRIADELGPAARVCEVGVFLGGSLATWQDLFPDGLIAGVDIDPSARWPDGTITVISGQDDPALPGLLRQHAPQWDLIVDDASHDGDLTAATLGLLWPLVSPGGFYVIEDWFTGFGDYHGACKSPGMLLLAQSLLERLRPGSDTESVSYRYGMAVIRKKAQP
jgi:hypothetical protein